MQQFTSTESFNKRCCMLLFVACHDLLSCCMCTVEHPNNGQIGSKTLVLYTCRDSEVVLFQRLQLIVLKISVFSTIIMVKKTTIMHKECYYKVKMKILTVTDSVSAIVKRCQQGLCWGYRWKSITGEQYGNPEGSSIAGYMYGLENMFVCRASAHYTLYHAKL